MKLQALSLLFAAAAANAADDVVETQDQRNLATLAQKWNLTEPSFAYDANTFSLTFPVTDYINTGMARCSLWTAPDCQEGNVNIESNPAWASVRLEENAALAAAADFTPITGTQIDSGVFNNRDATVFAQFNPQAIADASFYSESTDADGNLSAEVVFCIRFGLWTTSDMNIQGSELEVNFLETIITLTVDLTDGFEIDAINVTPKDRLERTANVAYEVVGYECTENKVRVADPSPPRNQGEVIVVCVTPEDDAKLDGIYMRSIDSFAWTRGQAGDANQIVQDAIVNKGPAGNLLTDYNPAACVGTLICQFSTILFADFFFQTGQVDGAGVASLQFGQQGLAQGRKLRAGGDRKLQEANEEPSAAEFDLNIDVNQAVARSNSGASSSALGAALSLAMMAGVAMF